MERIFVLYDSDEYYATRFMEYFKKRRDIGFELVAFTRFDNLKDYLKGHSADVLLLGENMETEELSNVKNVRYVYKLSDKTGLYHEEGYTLINKYQMVQAIISDIKADYMRHENESGSIKSDNVNLLSIVSPIQVLESLVFAWSAGLLLSEQKRVLLVSMELLPVRLIATTDYSNWPLTELVYYIKENSDIIPHIKELASYQGALSYLAGIANAADILALSKEDAQRWITALKTQTEYELIIFYICSNSEAAQELINASDTVLYCHKDDVYADNLYAEWIAQMDRTGIRLPENKLLKLTLPKETAINRLPATAPELSGARCWSFARQYLGSLY